MRRGTLVFAGLAAVVVGALAAGAIAATGYAVVRPTTPDATVWVLQGQGAGARYASIDTALGEVTGVKSVDDPSDIVQAGDAAEVFTQSFAKAALIDPARPADLPADSSALAATPAGTAHLVAEDGFVAYVTDAGQVYAGPIGQAPTPIAPAGAVSYTADAVAIGVDGILYSYSHAARAVLRVDLASGAELGSDPLADGPTAGTLTVVGGRWALLDSAGARLWFADGSVPTGLGADAALQQPSAGAAVAVVDRVGLYSFDLRTGVKTMLTTAGGGFAAAPVVAGGVLYAAWLPSAGSGQLWSASGGMRSLGYGGRTAAVDPDPVFRGGAADTVLSDGANGWSWSVPTGALITGSQDWQASALGGGGRTTGTPHRVTTPKPPVAVADAFGVRADSLAALPVLLNDYDPNDDVLSIAPGSVTAVSPAGFGAVSVTDDGQSLAVAVAAGATGTATFSYRVTDGTFTSPPAEVALTVHPAAEEGTPQWCGVAGCLARWPSPEVAPGSTTSVQVLDGFVDPDGDPLFLAGASASAGSVVAQPDGTVTVKAPSGSGAQTLSVAVVVSDIEGRTARKTLDVAVVAAPVLALTPFTMLTTADQPATVDPVPHLVGAVGLVVVTAANPPAGAPATVSVDGSGATFRFLSSTPGSYAVSLGLRDTASGATAQGVVRVTVLPKGQRLLSTAPVTVFVRADSDTSVDVFSAVSNPFGAVLLLSDAVAHPADGVWSLSAAAVAESQLRVAGQTTDGRPGLLGTVSYTVSDGSGDPDLTARGLATVYLLPDSPPQRPIAADDSARVRVGGEVDIPVLANDVSASRALALDPASVSAPKGAGLAFAAGPVLRYLAPARPGTYRIRYSAYPVGSPGLEDTATVAITVVPMGGNRPPQPVGLVARVAAGQSVSIPFSGFGIDPDGDAVALSRIVNQPAHGTAAISATGDAIVYTAEPNAGGRSVPVSFDYEVRDALGDTGVAEVRVGVLGSLVTDPAPIAYSDYVEVQAGQRNKVVVLPLANDVDPTGGGLHLAAVAPYARPGTTRFAELALHLPKQVTGDSVTITAPSEKSGIGALDYTYAVTDAAGNTSTGLIVVRVVTGPVLSYPVVADTVVTLAQRDALAAGLDVVGGKVAWSGGDVSSLRMTLVGQLPGVSAAGTSIRVSPVPAAGLFVPFRLAGTDFAGHPVATYGFLRIPSEDDTVVALRDGAAQTVAEGASVGFDMASLVALPSGSRLDVDAPGVAASGARDVARCTAAGTRVTYSAGAGAPWQDSCIVPVRLAGQSRYTVVAVPISIVSSEPVVSAASLTADPGGAAASLDLARLTTWSTGDVGALQFAVANADSSRLFAVALHGQTLTATAKDSATPGLAERLWLSIPGRPAVARAAITLKVGVLPAVLPIGASVSQTCTTASASCTVKAVGVAGEVDPFAGTPLTVAAVDQSPACPAVTFAVASPSQVEAKWGASALGGSCTTTFTVADAAGRHGTGALAFTLQGAPLAPDSLVQTGAGEGSVTLAVAPGAAAGSSPVITGFRLYIDGSPAGATCSPSGVCPPITGLVDGVKHQFAAASVSAAGESAGRVETTAWAYRAPAAPQSATAVSGYDAARTTVDRGAVEVVITSSDAATSAFRVRVGATTTTVAADPSGATRVAVAADVGAQSFAVTAMSSIPPPPGAAAQGGTVTGSVDVYGSPMLTPPSASSLAVPQPGRIVVTDSARTAHPSDRPGDLEYVAASAGAAQPCRADAAGALSTSAPTSGAVTQAPPTIAVAADAAYDVYACFSNGYGVAAALIGTVLATPAPAPGGYTYAIADSAAPGDPPDYSGTATGPAAPSGLAVVYGGDADPATGQLSAWGAVPAVTVRYCLAGDLSRCSPGTAVAAAAGSAGYQMKFAQAPVLQCATDGTLSVGYDATYLDAQDLPAQSLERVQYYNSRGRRVAPDSPDIASVAARWTLTWPTADGFAPYSRTERVACG